MVIGKLPALSDPAKYAGLYIFDFGDHVALGYTAAEIEFLLADPRYAGGTVYKIYRASPDGTLEIHGVNTSRWNLTTGLVFRFRDRRDAVAAHGQLKRLSAEAEPPGSFDLFLIETAAEEFPFALILRYLQELDDALSSWLLRIDFQAGERVEGGSQVVNPLLAKGVQLLFDRFEGEGFRKSRPRQEVLGAVSEPVQR